MTNEDEYPPDTTAAAPTEPIPQAAPPMANPGVEPEGAPPPVGAGPAAPVLDAPPKAAAREPEARTTIQHNVPVTRSPEAFIAEEAGRKEEDVTRVTNEDGLTAITTHTRPGTVVMYKPTERSGWVPRIISRSAIGPNLVNGWKEFCGDCGYKHINGDDIESTDPNLCSARNPVAVRVCPVCEKRIYDNVATSITQVDEDPDAPVDNMVITEDPYENSTGLTRTKTSLDAHLWGRHARQAEMMGVPIPASMAEEIQALRSVSA